MIPSAALLSNPALFLWYLFFTMQLSLFLVLHFYFSFFSSHSSLLSLSPLPLIVTISVSCSHPFTPSAIPLPFSLCCFSVFSLSLSVFTSFLVFLYPPSFHRQSSLAAAAASFSSLFAAIGPLACCVQGNKSHQAGTQAPRLPLHVGQSGQFAMVWWAEWTQEQ